jgi:hypothetical protein
MATLQSPGVQVTVIDESFYTPAAPGTVPIIFVATAQDKPILAAEPHKEPLPPMLAKYG